MAQGWRAFRSIMRSLAGVWAPVRSLLRLDCLRFTDAKPWVVTMYA
jgi:hypothetical protein